MKLAGSHAEAVHPRVDHDIARLIGRELLPAADLLWGVEAGPGREGPRRVCVVRADAVEDNDAGAERKRAQGFGFRPGRHEEVAAARLVQRLRAFARAETVTVRLDRRPGGHSRAGLQPAPILLEGAAVDGQPQGSMAGHCGWWAFHRPSTAATKASKASSAGNARRGMI